jgi:iron-sulfur cluster repair protein YtfE (RIC family)
VIDDIPFLDDATRPKAPNLSGVTAAQRAHGRRLSIYHRHHLKELARVRDALDRLQARASAAGEVTERIAGMTMVENYRRFGALCGEGCALLHMHHSIEDAHIFPVVRTHPAMRAVVDRLSAEHRTVHALLVRLMEVTQGLDRPDPEALAAARQVFDALERVIVSHFGYEETALEEALGLLAVDL